MYPNKDLVYGRHSAAVDTQYIKCFDFSNFIDRRPIYDDKLRKVVKKLFAIDLSVCCCSAYCI
jgi:hypothetical protein